MHDVRTSFDELAMFSSWRKRPLAPEFACAFFILSAFYLCLISLYSINIKSNRPLSPAKSLALLYV